jgi:hypothetical protein
MSRAENWSKEISGKFGEHLVTTYRCYNVALSLERAVVDLHCGVHSALIHSNSSALEVACPPPGIGAKKVQENSKPDFALLTWWPALLLSKMLV